MQSQSHLSSYLSLRNVTADVGPKVFLFFVVFLGWQLLHIYIRCICNLDQ
jgi:hypothetical protein